MRGFIFPLIIGCLIGIYISPHVPDSWKYSKSKQQKSESVKTSSREDDQKPSLKIDENVFAPYDDVKVYFTAPTSYASDAWIGIIPSSVPHGDETVNDQYDISYQYIEKNSSGHMVFKAPRKSGSYDLRMHDTDRNGREVASVSFLVIDE